MEKENKKNKTEEDFKVHDKRKIGKDEEGLEEDKKDESLRVDEAEPEKQSQEDKRSYTLPPADFVSFIMSLSTSAMVHLGKIKDPSIDDVKTDLESARYTIDIISLLKEKTDGNLTREEEDFMEKVLFDLRMLFVDASGK